MLFTKIKKRDGREVPFDDSKITDAIFQAARAVGGEDRELAVSLTLEVLRALKQKYNGQIFGVEDVQDVVEKVLIEKGHARTAKAYILYRDKRTRIREAKTELMDVVEDIIRETDRDNANVGNSPSAKMLQIASAASRNYYLTRMLDEDYSLAHRRGDIHIHDLDFYATTINCLQIPLDDLLREGFDNGHGYISLPKGLLLLQPWQQLSCRVPRMICMAASLSPFSINRWLRLLMATVRMRYTRLWRPLFTI